jgi:hypothetical protein
MQNPKATFNWPSNFRGPLQDLNIEKFATRGLAMLIAYAVIRSLVGAVTRPFWYDEVCTWIVVRQTTIAGIWSALTNAADAQSPGFYLIERISAALVHNEELAFRLPSIIAFCCITICLFVFARRRVGGGYALICAAIPLATSLFNWYATEARPYSMVVACIAVALVAYQRAPSTGWTLVLALAFAASVSFNYYAVLAMIPFGLAELEVFVTRRQIRWRVWIALAIGVAPLAVFWPLLANLKRYYGEHYLAGASLSGLIHIYGSFFVSSPPLGGAIATVALLGILRLIAAVAIESTSATTNVNTQAHEYVLVLGLLGLPSISFLLAKITHTGTTERYVLSAILGISLAAAYILPLLNRSGVTLAISFLLALLTVQEASFWVAHKHNLSGFESPATSLESLVNSTGYPNLPVMVSDGLEYLPIAHYAAPPWSERFGSLVDVQGSLAFASDNVVDKELIVLRSFAPLHVYDFPASEFQQRSFLLYSSSGSGGDPHDWWAARLLQDGHALKALAVDHSRVIYLVTRTPELH